MIIRCRWDVFRACVPCGLGIPRGHIGASNAPTGEATSGDDARGCPYLPVLPVIEVASCLIRLGPVRAACLDPSCIFHIYSVPLPLSYIYLVMFYYCTQSRAYQRRNS
ncbi:hypothetical protein M8818_003373 [Zalaria obscura]|uniref:Uncharacterized protein n=1 Tax=Zalaria obscura TaxID=2024903 RepID=A0ACC3SFH4_9PEZI